MRIEANIEQTREDERAFRSEQREREKHLDERIDKLVSLTARL